jgi:uncharacterized membrane protein YphA (DoxX/SURF4 family)
MNLPAWAALPARLAVGGVLAAAGVGKLLLPPEEFAYALEAYRLFPFSWLMPMARTLPWAELGAAALVLTGFQARAGAVSAAFLFASFLVVLSSVLWRGLDLGACGCFGGLGPRLSPRQTLAMDAVLLALSGLLFFDREKRFSLDRLRSRSRQSS